MGVIEANYWSIPNFYKQAIPEAIEGDYMSNLTSYKQAILGVIEANYWSIPNFYKLAYLEVNEVDYQSNLDILNVWSGLLFRADHTQKRQPTLSWVEPLVVGALNLSG